ncbi:hypothetical protein [Nocardia cyriacigeorgica]|uniref:hypothetical protein n=1 Tax=Nocardia cyriacigeorgica TaxID=135487 RepID=UPI0018960EC6|nr:hypothetical protein [Nocardia cyriacigeorgica]MBF6435336.1 hypothetical protein [Nocardia cyriacigeorgica]
MTDALLTRAAPSLRASVAAECWKIPLPGRPGRASTAFRRCDRARLIRSRGLLIVALAIHQYLS